MDVPLSDIPTFVLNVATGIFHLSLKNTIFFKGWNAKVQIPTQWEFHIAAIYFFH